MSFVDGDFPILYSVTMVLNLHHKFGITLLSLVGLKVSFITPYHAQANPTEESLRKCPCFFSKYCEKHKDWDLQIPAMLFSLEAQYWNLQVTLLPN